MAETGYEEGLARLADRQGLWPDDAKHVQSRIARAVASGELRGDGMRSVMELLPELAGRIADVLGVTRHQLPKVGASAEVVTAAICSQETIAPEPDSSPPSG